MNEAILYYLWQHRLCQLPSHGADDGGIEVISPGVRNHDSGPDFLNARVKIEGTEWAGNVEIHVNSSDWFVHRHFADPSFQNIILHVVYHDDRPVFYSNGTRIPTLELKSRVDASFIEEFKHFVLAGRELPCSTSVPSLPRLLISSYLDRLCTERLETKTRELFIRLQVNKGDWEQTFFETLCAAMGFHTNGPAFGMLGRLIPIKILWLYVHDRLRLEALLFGMAGLLPEHPCDEYSGFVCREFLHLKNKHSLQPMPGHLWKFMRMRPGGFPTLRLSQLAGILHNHPRIFGEILETLDPDKLIQLFESQVSEYWATHYVFGKPVAHAGGMLGVSAAESLLINAVVPAVFAWGSHRDEDSMCDSAVDILIKLKPERNSVVKRWEQSGIVPQNAADTQALTTLYRNYCFMRRCHDCSIGIHILNNFPAL